MPLLDNDLRQMLVLRWQLCEPDDSAEAARPYNAAWTRAALLFQILTEFHDETAAGRVAGIATGAELAGLQQLLEVARAHADAMALQMIDGE